MSEHDQNKSEQQKPLDIPGDALVVNQHCWIPREAISQTFSRSSGPGGQAVNKINSRVQLRVSIKAIIGLSEAAAGRLRRLAGQRCTSDGELLIQCDTHRSQHANRRECAQRLCDLIAQAVVEPKRRKRIRPSRAMIERRLAQKKQQAQKKQRRRLGRSPHDD